MSQEGGAVVVDVVIIPQFDSHAMAGKKAKQAHGAKDGDVEPQAFPRQVA